MRVLISEKLSQHKFKTPEGYLICQDAILARTGKQTYRKNEVFADSDDDSEIEVDRPYDEVFSPETLASFENKPVTVEHPGEDVNSENWKSYQVGFVRDIKQGKTENGEDVVLGTLVIQDADTIEEILNGEHCELSCGYDCDIQDSENPKQTHIRGNHVALCERGRAGIAKIVDSKTKDSDKIVDSTLPNAYTENLDKFKKYIKMTNKVGEFYDLVVKNESNDRVRASILNMFNDYKGYGHDGFGKELHKIVDSINDVNKDTIAFLIKDEEEAIEGYERAIEEAKRNGDEQAVVKFQHILDEEIEHIQELKDLLQNDVHDSDFKSWEYSAKQAYRMLGKYIDKYGVTDGFLNAKYTFHLRGDEMKNLIEYAYKKGMINEHLKHIMETDKEFIGDSINDGFSTQRMQFRTSDIDDENSYLGTTEWSTPKGSMYVYEKNGKIVVEAKGIADGDSFGKFYFNSVQELNKWLRNGKQNEIGDSVKDSYGVLSSLDSTNKKLYKVNGQYVAAEHVADAVKSYKDRVVFTEKPFIATRQDCIKALKEVRMSGFDVWNTWQVGNDKKGWLVQIQNYGKETVEVSLKTAKVIGKKLESQAWGRIWKDGNIKFNQQGPLYVVRQEMMRFLTSTSDSSKDLERVKLYKVNGKFVSAKSVIDAIKKVKK